MSLNFISITFVLPSYPPDSPHIIMILNSTLLKLLARKYFTANVLCSLNIPFNHENLPNILLFTKVSPFFPCSFFQDSLDFSFLPDQKLVNS